MTLTDAPSTQQAAAPEVAPDTGLHSVVTTTDHKVVGKLYIGFGLLFTLAALVLGALVALEGADPDSVDVFADADAVAQASSFFWVIGVLAGAVPLLVGIATAVVPLQIGSPASAYPRAAAMAGWTWLVGAIVAVVSFAVDGGLGASTAGTDADAVSLTVAAIILMSLALVVASVCVMTTVVSLRPEGMSLRRVPLFAWSMLVAGALWVASLPVLIANLLVAYVDLRGREAIYVGVEDLLDDQIAWFFTNPQVMVLLIPVLGIVADIVQGSVHDRQRNYDVMLAGIGLFGLLAFGAHFQSFFDRSELDVTNELVYIATGIAVAVPAFALGGGWIDTLVQGRGRIGRPTSALLGAITAWAVLELAVLAGVVRVIEPLDLIGTQADLGVGVLALFGALVGAWAGWVWWSPKLTARTVPAPLAAAAGGLLALGGVVAGVSRFVGGFADAGDSILDTLSVLAFIGLLVGVLGALAALAGLLGQVAGRGTAADDDPWGGVTLEWLAPTPPPEGNFVEPVGVVASAQPLLDPADDDTDVDPDDDEQEGP